MNGGIILRSQIDTKAHYLDTFYDAFIHTTRHRCVVDRARETRARGSMMFCSAFMMFLCCCECIWHLIKLHICWSLFGRSFSFVVAHSALMLMLMFLFERAKARTGNGKILKINYKSEESMRQ